MEEPDNIEVGFVFNTEPALEDCERFLDRVPRRAGPDFEADEFNISAYNESESTYLAGTDEEAAATLATADSCKVGVWMDRYELSILVDRSGKELLTPHPALKFSVTIYSFQDPDDESERDGVSQRRQEFLEVLAQAANVLEPRWGFGRRTGLAIGDDETIGELASRCKPPLYEYNVFRPETVEAIGRDTVLNAPAWYT